MGCGVFDYYTVSTIFFLFFLLDFVSISRDTCWRMIPYSGPEHDDRGLYTGITAGGVRVVHRKRLAGRLVGLFFFSSSSLSLDKSRSASSLRCGGFRLRRRDRDQRWSRRRGLRERRGQRGLLSYTSDVVSLSLSLPSIHPLLTPNPPTANGPLAFFLSLAGPRVVSSPPQPWRAWKSSRSTAKYVRGGRERERHQKEKGQQS
ncbi:hypothetical protein VTN02DRAFT_2666 [Thermoascus thermophilus]